MALGYAPYILEDISAALKSPKNSWKVDLQGFAQMLYTGNGASPIRVTAEDTGGKREHRYTYKQRATVAQTDTAYSCEQVLTPARKEITVSTPNTRQIAWYIPDSLLTNYQGIYANRGANLGGKVVSEELMDIVFSSANALLQGVNSDLQTLIAWGNNSTATAPKNAAQTINLPQATSTMVLGNGISKIMTDFKRNGLVGRPNFVGLGLGFEYASFTRMSSAATDNGFDNRIATAMYDFYADQTWESNTATNQIGVFEPGSIQAVEYLETDFRKGQLANSFFFQVVLPTMDSQGNAVPVRFDAQLKEIDCPVTLNDAYTGDPGTYTRGTQLIMWKNFGLFQTPTDNFRNDDRQAGVTGALRYTLTNS